MLAIAFLFLSCGDEDGNPLNGSGSDACSLPNGSLKWTTDGGLKCASASLFADQAMVMTVNGISQTGLSMTLELDSMQPGTYEMKAGVNSLLFTDQLGMAWQSTDDNPGTLVVSSNNASTNLFEASFNCTARNPLGMSKSISGGTLRVFYTE
ncbi:MAG: hypothetical protein JNL88_12160 [Bacteroidia bacterium]|nr:hypothetical protein [Bacteroidia bacterium]